MSKWGFFAQGGLNATFPSRHARLIHARPLFVKVTANHSANIGAIRQHAPKGTTFAILRYYRSQQHLDNPIARAEEHYRAIKEVWDGRYDAATGFNEIGTFDPAMNEAYCRFQEKLAELLWNDGIFYVFGCDSTWYPGWPPGTGRDPEWEWFWTRRLEMYKKYTEMTGKAVLRCRHEYYGNGREVPEVERHPEELRFLRGEDQDIDILVGEWGWDGVDPDGSHWSWWEQGVTAEQYVSRARASDSLPAVGRCAFLAHGYGDWQDFDVSGGNPGAEALWSGPWGEEPLIAYLWEGQPAGGAPNRPWYRVRDASTPEPPTPEPQYPGASRFVPAHANGKGGTRPGIPSRILLHYTTGGSTAFEGTINWFQNPDSGVCTPYVISREGEVVQMALEEEVAFHAGVMEWNKTSIGVEVANNNLGEPIAEPAYQALLGLCRYLMSKWTIPLDEVKGHNEVLTGKTDPKDFPWDRFRADLGAVNPPDPRFGQYADRYEVITREMREER